LRGREASGREASGNRSWSCVEYIFVCLDSEKPKKTSEAVESRRIKKRRPRSCSWWNSAGIIWAVRRGDLTDVKI
jgi:hypothetical protein